MLRDQLADAAEGLAPLALGLGGRRLGGGGAPDAAARTSSSVIRPCGPVPWTAARSTPSSSATRRTSGVARTRSVAGAAGAAGAAAGSARGAFLGGGRRGAVAADHDQHRPDGDGRALLDEDLRDGPGGGRRDLDRRLVRLDLDERLVLGHLVADRDEPAGDLSLRQPLAEIRQLELVRHPAAEDIGA